MDGLEIFVFPQYARVCQTCLVLAFLSTSETNEKVVHKSTRIKPGGDW